MAGICNAKWPICEETQFLLSAEETQQGRGQSVRFNQDLRQRDSGVSALNHGNTAL
jgi:hypothetical protein